MNTIRHTLAALAGSAVLGACVTGPTPAEWEANFMALEGAHFFESLNIVDDPLNPSVEIDTRGAHRDYQYDFDLQNDQFLRTNIFRETGNIAIQGYVISESLEDWLSPTQVTFSTGLKTRSVDRLDFDVNCNSFGGCRHTEVMVFNISQAELRQTILELETSGDVILSFRIQGQKGWDRDGRFHIGELKAMLEAVEQHSR